MLHVHAMQASVLAGHTFVMHQWPVFIPLVQYCMACCALQGQIFMTHPTRQVCGMLLKDFVRVSGRGSDALYTEKHLEEALQRTQLIDFHQTIEVDGIKASSDPEAVPSLAALLTMLAASDWSSSISARGQCINSHKTSCERCVMSSKSAVPQQAFSVPLFISSNRSCPGHIRLMPIWEFLQELQVFGTACRSQHGEQAMCWGRRCSWWRSTACACCTLATTRVLQTDTCLQRTCPRPSRTYVRPSQSSDSTLHPTLDLQTHTLCVMLFGGHKLSQPQALLPVEENCAGAATCLCLRSVARDGV